MRAVQSRLSLLAILCIVHWVSCSVVRFELNLTWEDQEVAGYVRKAILSNGQLPGPTLRMKQGENVEILVTNNMPFATTIHFHGVAQLGTPWCDGVPGLSQEPIEPGDQFIYKWTAVDYGSYVYHSHSRGQLIDGLYGAIYIEPDEAVEKPFSLITEDASEIFAMVEAEAATEPLMLTDWRFLTSEVIWEAEVNSGCENLCSQSILINGKGSAWCLPQERINDLATFGQKKLLDNYTMTDLGCFPPIDSIFRTFPRNPSLLPKGFVEGCIPTEGPTEILEVDRQSRYISRDVISLAGAANLVFSIDEHPMYVYAIDGRYVEPYLVQAIEIPAGSRYSILVQLDKDDGDYTIRAANNGINQIINGTAILSYTAPEAKKGHRLASQPYITEVGNLISPKDTVLLNESLVVPFPIQLPSPTVNQTFILNIALYNSAYRWQLGNSTFDMEFELSQPALFNYSSIPYPHSVTTLNDTWVDIIFNLTTGDQPPHAMHKHSSKFFVIGYGYKPFTYSSVAEAMTDIPHCFNFEHPQLRDTFSTPAAEGPFPTWLAIRYHVINPGAFLLHCHLQMHQSGGMALALMDGIDAWPVVPEEYRLPGVDGNHDSGSSSQRHGASPLVTKI